MRNDKIRLLPYSSTESRVLDENFQGLTIGTLATLAGVHIETIRFYQRKGLLPEPDKPYGSIRRYGASDVARVQFVKSAQRLGFSLDEISRLLLLDDGTHCDEARKLGENKLAMKPSCGKSDSNQSGQGTYIPGSRSKAFTKWYGVLCASFSEKRHKT
jgi:MerR family transcriptional regulator, mercuric resistance operon regulatory protein